MDKIRILVADENRYSCEVLTEFFSLKPEIEVIAAVNNGQAALDIVTANKIDVFVTDLILPELDGLGLIEKLYAEKMLPPTIVITNLCHADIVQRCMSSAVRYFMLKPYNIESLYKHICAIGTSAMEVAFAQDIQPQRSIDERITNIFLTIGIPAHIKGYHFLREAVRLVVANPDIINRITKELYPTIAYNFETSASKVERAMRHAIDVAWSRGRIENINQLFGYTVYTKSDKPTNSEFIALVADKLTMENSHNQ